MERTGSDALRVVLVSSVAMNPYVALLQNGLASHEGVSAKTIGALTPRLVWRRRHDVDVLHLHWAELLVESPSGYRAVKKLVRLVAGLWLARALRKTVVYTVHNLSPHGGSHPRIAKAAITAALGVADRLHVHDAAAASRIRVRRARERVFVAPHGSYVGAYPNTCARAEARRTLGLSPDAFVFLLLGQIRAYKGVEDLIAAFARTASCDYALVIAGHAPDATYLGTIRAMAGRDSRIHLSPGYVPDDQVQVYMGAADVCVLPYRAFTTSGAALLAFSFGRPIVAPDSGAFREMVQGERGRLFDPRRLPESLAESLVSAREMDPQQSFRQTLALAGELSWDRVAALHLAAYRSARKDRR